MVAIAASSSAYPMATGYRLAGGALAQPATAAVRADAAMMAQVRVNDASFQQELKVASDPNAVDPAITARGRAVQAHTVFRQGGQVVAAVWRDGQTTLSNGLAGRMDWPALERRTAGMTDAQRRTVIADEIARQLGSAVQVQRFGETGQAPSRGAIDEEQARGRR
ncbi:hypothetical protein [Azospirillum thermophilum]|uniref:Uncharacterized protein n=1 Tax=Azospirillum thermophilum TaxID=2202148 RepID=A0A2S2CUG8_9PROT|nr:hypothetical protein [Azospirillum thermophilum]AWK88152.1 hypothetical protein DEW08_18685 [Azospirillum thermophilum]